MPEIPADVILSQPPALSWDELDAQPDLQVPAARNGQPVIFDYQSNSQWIWEARDINTQQFYKFGDAINTRLNSLAFANCLWQLICAPYTPITGITGYTDNDGIVQVGYQGGLA